MKRKTLIDAFSDWTTEGIFAVLDDFEVPWAEDDIAESLDLEYFGNVSGDKPISPLVEKIMTGDTLDDAEKLLIATAVFSMNAVNWNKVWNTLSLTYNPIENYAMVETMTNDETVIEYDNTHERTDDLEATSETSVYGFNSTDPVDSGKVVNTNGGTVTDTNTGSDTHTRNYTLERSGNIGVTTSQQMLQSERDLWKWNFFRDVVFPDLDRMLTLRIY